jgi:hypothetical protein
MLQEIDGITTYLQTEGLTLADARNAVEQLTESVEKDKTNPAKALYQCKLGTKYIALDSDLVTDPLFISGVVKIQENRLQDLTDAEKEAVDSLRKDGAATAEATEDDDGMTLVQKIRAGKRKQREEAESGEMQYMNTNFILGSAAVVERLWSNAGNILTKNRSGMTPQLLEAILFLKYNRRFWNQALVSDAYQMQRTARSQARINADAVQQEVEGEMEEEA